MFKKILEAYNKGSWAWRKGQPIDANPYNPDTEEDHHWSWEQGWNEAYYIAEEDGTSYNLN